MSHAAMSAIDRKIPKANLLQKQTTDFIKSHAEIIQTKFSSGILIFFMRSRWGQIEKRNSLRTPKRKKQRRDLKAIKQKRYSNRNYIGSH